MKKGWWMGWVLLFVLTFSACAQPAAEGVTVRLHRSGGIAGFDDTWEVTPEGQVIITSRGNSQQFDLSQDQQKALREALQAIPAAAYGQRYLSDPAVPDLMVYRLEVGEQWIEGDELKLPSSLADVIEFFQGLESPTDPSN